MAPVGNIETAIVQSGTAANVDTVLVDGRIIKRHGRLVAYDMPNIVARAKRSANRLLAAPGDKLRL